ACFWFIWKYEADYRIIATPFLVCFFYMLVRVFPGFVYAYETGFYTNEFIYLVFFGAIIALFLGYLFHNIIFRITNTTNKFNDSTIGYTYAFRKPLYRTLLVIILILVASGTYLYQGLPYYLQNFSDIISGSNDAAKFAEYRKLITKGHVFGGEYRGQGFIRTLQELGWSFALCLSYILFYFNRKTKNRLIFHITLILAF